MASSAPHDHFRHHSDEFAHPPPQASSPFTGEQIAPTRLPLYTRRRHSLLNLNLAIRHQGRLPSVRNDDLPLRSASLNNKSEIRNHESAIGSTSKFGRKKKNCDKKEKQKAKKPGLANRRKLTRMHNEPVEPEMLPHQPTKEEFYALPLAIQRKFFTDLDRLRFSQGSDISGVAHGQEQSSHKAHSNHVRRYSIQIESPLTPDLPDSPANAPLDIAELLKRHQLSREDQVTLAQHLRASVVLDAANKAMLSELARQNDSRYPSDESSYHSSPSSKHTSMDSVNSEHSTSVFVTTDPPNYMIDAVRWLDQPEDLDLQLALEDYHAAVRQEHNCTAPKRHHPSFRRHLSMSKNPFARSPTPLERPAATPDVLTRPSSPTHHNASPGGSQTSLGNLRSKTRQLSLIISTKQSSVAPGIVEKECLNDPSAAHYQDPGARLRLRQYLASPQKFDEAVAIGFPSRDTFLAAAPDMMSSGSRPALQPNLCHSRHVSVPHLRSFLHDDDEEDDDNIQDKDDVRGHQMVMDDVADETTLSHGDLPSTPSEPESPKTPQSMHAPGKLRSVSTLDPSRPGKLIEDLDLSQIPPSSREMTVRMTLTRPDLRSHDEQMYGWQKSRLSHHRKTATLSPVRHYYRDTPSPVILVGDRTRKESVEQNFAGVDHREYEKADDQGVMKRFWKIVRRASPST